MEKRKRKRKPVNLKVRLFWGKNTYPGTVTSISEKGMFISTKMSPPSDSVFEVVLNVQDMHLKVPVNVKYAMRIDVTVDSVEKNGIGVEFLDVPPQYLDYFKNLEAE
ncbi:MAG: PilZ domain-containing protein [Nitrospirota bacterium]